jgi:hypothetical protein
MLNDYYFVTRWRVPAAAEEVYDIMHDAAQYPRWWPAVYLKAEPLAPGADGGPRFRFYSKGWLPYTLRWESEEIRADRPNSFTIRATGDFNGRGIWTFCQHGPYTDVDFDWQLRADKPLLRNLSPVLKPMFAANHRWAMEQGRRSLELEVMRRAATDQERESVPRPPEPNRTSGLVLAGTGLGAVALAVAVSRTLRKSSNRE